MNASITERDIEAWQHTTWADIVGNSWLKFLFSAAITRGRRAVR